ncbi:glycosyltransferase family A protein [Paucibacter sediminis]|uniref:Glycosyltransferase family A protein n=1 Tax=Paucibacter sediminis TaxID=3019553 RepID=A0AA95SNS4_9BURK|nr:glycosyltransferase family A protein [Paucibacter sp. S2-9]WIT10056.1 glycosyltransferase family A protein [Paucibacter sp. S2-9]
MPALSLILATVGRTTDLDRCLDALAAQTSKDFEVLVIDQNRDARLLPHVARAQAAGLDVRHHRMDRASLSGARNLGLTEARGLYVAFPDDDCWYEPDTVEQVLSAFAASPELGGLSINWVEQSAALGEATSGSELNLAAWRAYRGGEASSISLFLRAELARQLQGFDERLGVGQWFGAAEEIDLVLRALGTGARVARLREARVHHAYGRQAAIPARRLWVSSLARARGTGAVYAKHRLSAWVVARGLVAPVLKAVLRLNWQACVVGLATSLGRLQGMRAWRRAERKHHLG